MPVQIPIVGAVARLFPREGILDTITAWNLGRLRVRHGRINRFYGRKKEAMLEKYNFTEIEKKWQKIWEE